jgi:hypothetical protein
VLVIGLDGQRSCRIAQVRVSGTCKVDAVKLMRLPLFIATLVPVTVEEVGNKSGEDARLVISHGQD